MDLPSMPRSLGPGPGRVTRRQVLSLGGQLGAGAVGGAAALRLDGGADLPPTLGEVVDVRAHGAVGDDDADDTEALRRAVRAALDAHPSSALTGQPTSRPAVVLLPPGVYRTSGPVLADLTTGSSAASDRRTLVLRGAGPDSSVLHCDGFDGSALHVWHGGLVLEDVGFSGGGNFTGTMLELGRQSGDDHASQCSLNRVVFRSTGPGATMLRATWVFDSSFTDVRFAEHGQGSVGLHIPPNEVDNCNNLSFRRCHWEGSVDATLMRIESSFGPSTTHYSLTFDTCHWETRSYRSRAIDVRGVLRVAFVGGHVPHGNEPDGAAAGVGAGDAVSPVRLVDVAGMTWSTAGVSREDGPADYPTRLLTLGGLLRGVVFQSCYFLTDDGRVVEDLSGLWQEDPDTPLDPSSRARPLHAVACLVNRYDSPELTEGTGAS